jgi:twin BRCT domain
MTLLARALSRCHGTEVWTRRATNQTTINLESICAPKDLHISLRDALVTSMANQQPPLELAKGLRPLQGAVICCTSLPPDRRDKIHEIADTLGAQTFYDLTMQVTHLVIGETSTPKYAYVAKERPDVKIVLPEFFDAVREAWMNGEEVDVAAAEITHRAPALYGLRICLTGFSNRNPAYPCRPALLTPPPRRCHPYRYQRQRCHPLWRPHPRHHTPDCSRAKGQKVRHGPQVGRQGRRRGMAARFC